MENQPRERMSGLPGRRSTARRSLMRGVLPPRPPRPSLLLLGLILGLDVLLGLGLILAPRAFRGPALRLDFGGNFLDRSEIELGCLAGEVLPLLDVPLAGLAESLLGEAASLVMLFVML